MRGVKRAIPILIVIVLAFLPLASFASQTSKVNLSTISKVIFLATGYLPENFSVVPAKAKFFGREITGTYVISDENVEIRILKGLKELEKGKVEKAIEKAFESLKIPKELICGINITSLSIFYFGEKVVSNFSAEPPTILVNLSFNFTLLGSQGRIEGKATLQYGIPKENQSELLLIWTKIWGLRGNIFLPITSLDSIGVGASKIASILSELGGKGRLVEASLDKVYFEKAEFYSYFLKQEMNVPKVLVEGISKISVGRAQALEISLKNGKLLRGTFQIFVRGSNSILREVALRVLYLIGKEYGSLMGSEIAKDLERSDEIIYDGNTFYLKLQNTTSGEIIKITSQGPSPFYFSATSTHSEKGELVKVNFEVLNWTEFYPIKEVVTPQMSGREAYFIALSALNLSSYQVGDWKASLRTYLWDDEEYKYYSVDLMVRTSNGEAIPTIVYISPSGYVIKVSKLLPTCVLPLYMGPLLAAITIGILGTVVEVLYLKRRARPSPSLSCICTS